MHVEINISLICTHKIVVTILQMQHHVMHIYRDENMFIYFSLAVLR